MVWKLLVPCYLIIAYAAYGPLLLTQGLPWGRFLIDLLYATGNFLTLAVPLSLVAWWSHHTLYKK